jgi:hypothetical protein
MGQGPQQPEFLSTHPSDDRRAKDLAALLPEAGELYAQAAIKFGQGEAVQIAAANGPMLTAPTQSNFAVPEQQPLFLPTGSQLPQSPAFPHHLPPLRPPGQ